MPDPVAAIESLLFYEGTVWYKTSFDDPRRSDSRLFVYRNGVEIGFAEVTLLDPALELPRLDTNDLPKAADAAPNEWFERAA